MSTKKARIIKKLESILDNLEDKAIDLYVRWLDEQKYEDSTEYTKSLVMIGDKICANMKDCKVTKSHVKPFGLTFVIEGYYFQFRFLKGAIKYKQVRA